MSGGADGGHFIGLGLAVLLFLGLVAWLFLPASARFGKRRWLVAAAALPVLFALGLLGNGQYRTHFSTALTPVTVPAGVTQKHVDAALAAGLSDELVGYYSALEGKPRVHGADVARGFKATVIGVSELGKHGISTSPPLAPDQRAILLTYDEEANAGLVALGSGKAERDARWQFVQTLAMDYLAELIVLEMFRTASTDAERLAILGALAPTVPQAAEWISRELRRFKAAGLSPEVAAAVDKKLSHVQLYIDDPTMRALPAGTKVTLP